VDGLLFINLSDESWGDMGITNRFHVRKLQLILKSYRVRYQRRKDKVEMTEEDDLLSEISPSELSEMIAAEDQDNDAYSSDESSSVSSVCRVSLSICLVGLLRCGVLHFMGTKCHNHPRISECRC
jgi:hypothetical protein